MLSGMEPFNLNLRHLRAVALMKRLGSLTAAAAAAHLTQPALTQGLARLERALGVPLFDRRPDGTRPTSAGDAIADAVDAAFDHLSRGSRVPSVRGFSRPEDLVTGPQLKALVAFADAGSLAGAATAIGLSQPSLHRALHDLSQIVGAPLVERRGRGLVLTDPGRRLARGARLAKADLRLGIAEATGAPDDGRAVVIGTMPLARARLLPLAINSLLRTRPDARVRVVEGSWHGLVEPLRDGYIDMMIGAMRDIVPADLAQHELLVDPVAVVGRAGHPLAGTSPTLQDLARFPWVVSAPGAPLRARWETMFSGSVQPPAPIECGSVIVTRGLLAGSDMLTLLSPEQIAVELAAGVLASVTDALPELERRIGITTRSPWRAGRLQQAAMDALGSAASVISSGNVMTTSPL